MITLPVAGAGLCLAALIGSGITLYAGWREETNWRVRMQAVTAPYHRAHRAATASPALVTIAERNDRSLPRRLLGWREERRSHYPMHWAAMLGLCALPATAAAWLATRLGGGLAWCSLPVFAGLLCRTALAFAAGRVSSRLLAQFPDALSAVARAVRIGVPLSEAVRLVARDSQPPTREEFSRAADQAMIGLPLENALREMAERTDVAEYRFFATALALQSQTGGALTETLDNLGETIRKRQAARKRAHALASEARASIYVLAALPIVVGVLLFVVNPGYVGMLFTDPGGLKLLAYAAFSLIFGMIVMRAIIARSLS